MLKKSLAAVIAGMLIVVSVATYAKSDSLDTIKVHSAIKVSKKAAPPEQPYGYSPEQIKKAYGIDDLKAKGKGKTIAIVNAYGCEDIRKDLKVFNKQYNLPDADLKIEYPSGRPSETDPGWAIETALDVEWAHAIAPEATILLVVAKTSSLEDMLGAVEYATKRSADVISMSWYADEFPEEVSIDSYFKNNGTIYIASSGNVGAGPMWPAASPNVIAVGGTSLPLDSKGNLTGEETAWEYSSGGISIYEAPPEYQTSNGITAAGRGIPDVSFNADPETGVAVYSSVAIEYIGTGWFAAGGTSIGAPAWSAIMTLVDKGHFKKVSDMHNMIYESGDKKDPITLRDIKSGSNGAYEAGLGYDFVTGMGSPAFGKQHTKPKK